MGFLIYVDSAYWYFNPYLKGINFTIHGCRHGRDE